MIRHAHLIAVVGSFLIGCTVLVVAGCAGVRSEASKQEEQGNTEATKEQARSSEATASEEARCEGTRTFKDKWSGWLITTNDVPGCPKGGLLSGTDKKDRLGGKDGDDEIHGLGDKDRLLGGIGSDVIYGGPGDDSALWGLKGDDVIYGGDGNDWLAGNGGEDVLYGGDGNDNLVLIGRAEGLKDTTRDELYCGPGKDGYDAGKLDYVDSSCEKKVTLSGRQ